MESAYRDIIKLLIDPTSTTYPPVLRICKTNNIEYLKLFLDIFPNDIYDSDAKVPLLFSIIHSIEDYDIEIFEYIFKNHKDIHIKYNKRTLLQYVSHVYKTYKCPKLFKCAKIIVQDDRMGVNELFDNYEYDAHCVNVKELIRERIRTLNIIEYNMYVSKKAIN